MTDLKPFLYGGIASCVAETATFPIDTAKTRLQLQGQAIDVRYVQHKYRGMFHCWTRVVAEEGFSTLYSGLAPALLRQAIYGTAKYGMYYTIKEVLPGDKDSPLRNVGCAVFAGSVSSAIANPTDLLKVRLQSKCQDHVKCSLYESFKDIYHKEGISGLWRGVIPTSQRSAVVAGVQLPVYDFTKQFFLTHGVFDDSSSNHLASSFCAGLCACLASSPIDVIRTRLMNQRKLIQFETSSSGLPIGPRLYKSSWDCGMWTVRNEGLSALYKGFVPAFTRMGPWNIIFFLVYEKLKAMSPSVKIAESCELE